MESYAEQYKSVLEHGIKKLKWMNLNPFSKYEEFRRIASKTCQDLLNIENKASKESVEARETLNVSELTKLRSNWIVVRADRSYKEFNKGYRGNFA